MDAWPVSLQLVEFHSKIDWQDCVERASSIRIYTMLFTLHPYIVAPIGATDAKLFGPRLAPSSLKVTILLCQTVRGGPL